MRRRRRARGSSMAPTLRFRPDRSGRAEGVLYHPAHEGTDASQAAAAHLSTRDGQLVVAREHGFDNWTERKR